MKPYWLQNLPVDKRVHNYRLSQAHRMVENIFGIASSRFRDFHWPIIGLVEKVVVITKAVVALHNFLMSLSTTKNNYSYCPSGYADREAYNGFVLGEWRKDTESLQFRPWCLESIVARTFTLHLRESGVVLSFWLYATLGKKRRHGFFSSVTEALLHLLSACCLGGNVDFSLSIVTPANLQKRMGKKHCKEYVWFPILWRLL